MKVVGFYTYYDIAMGKKRVGALEKVDADLFVFHS